ncbi:MAG TPA: universal stress protein [Sediminibacterium sp.]|nr:universal stress protein [Sediminibacterium sp.]
MNHLIIATDGSAYAPEVEKVGFALAEKLAASVTVVTIINKYLDYVPVDTGIVFENQWEARKAIARKELEAMCSRHPAIATESVCFIGDPKEDVLALAIEKSATFIVMGTHGRTGLNHLIMGSTAEYIVRHATMPVVVVPLNKAEH